MSPRSASTRRNDFLHPSRPTSRRTFLQALGVTSAAPLVAGLLPALDAVAQPPPAAPAPPVSLPPAPTTPPDPLRAQDAAEAQDLLNILRRRLGGAIDPASEAAVRSDLEDGVRSGRALRATVLGNGDEPAVQFRARIEGA
jgi:hypothetical protein